MDMQSDEKEDEEVNIIKLRGRAWKELQESNHKGVLHEDEEDKKSITNSLGKCWKKKKKKAADSRFIY